MARGLYVVDQLGPIEIADRPTLTTFTTFADICGGPQKILPKSRMDAGLTLDLEAWVDWSTTGTPTISMGFYWGVGASVQGTMNSTGTILAQTQLAAAPVATTTGGTAHMHWMGTLRAIGPGATGGTIHGNGYADLTNTVSPFSTTATWVMPTTKALRTVTLDTTADKSLAVGWAFGTSNAANAVIVTDFYAKVMS
jgi:hypothetical protein